MGRDLMVISIAKDASSVTADFIQNEFKEEYSQHFICVLFVLDYDGIEIKITKVD
jgi:hypothetical protein